MAAEFTLYSLGYEGRSLNSFLTALQSLNVQVVVDVRLNPISRKKGFSKRMLEAALKLSGISYQHEPRLGNPKDNRGEFREGNAAHGRQRFIAIAGDQGRAAIEQLAELAGVSTVAILCVERESERCHRAAVTTALEQASPHIRVVAVP